MLGLLEIKLETTLLKKASKEVEKEKERRKCHLGLGFFFKFLFITIFYRID